MLKLSIILLLLPALATCFVPQPQKMTHPATLTTTKSLFMVPRYDEQEQKWYPTSSEEEASAGYDIWGSLLRQGPNPFITRLFRPEEYEQGKLYYISGGILVLKKKKRKESLTKKESVGVLKFMAGDKVDRNTAQAEMDAYLQNPNDWAYNRFNGYEVDYLTLDQKQIVLTLGWSAIVVPLLGRGIYCVVTGDYFWDILPL